MLLGPVVQLDGCCQGEGTEVVTPMPWDALWGTGSSRAAQRITGGSADPLGIQVTPATG